MKPEEKVERIINIGKHLKHLNNRYGFNECPDHLTDALDEVRAALRKRLVGLVEA